MSPCAAGWLILFRWTTLHKSITVSEKLHVEWPREVYPARPFARSYSIAVTLCYKNRGSIRRDERRGRMTDLLYSCSWGSPARRERTEEPIHYIADKMAIVRDGDFVKTKRWDKEGVGGDESVISPRRRDFSFSFFSSWFYFMEASMC